MNKQLYSQSKKIDREQILAPLSLTSASLVMENASQYPMPLVQCAELAKKLEQSKNVRQIADIAKVERWFKT